MTCIEPVALCADADLLIRIVESDDHPRRAAHRALPCEFKVKRQAMVDHSKHFRTLLTNSRFKGSTAKVVELKEEDIVGVKLWLDIIHDKPTEQISNVTIEDLWYMLLAAHKFELNPHTDTAALWFEEWWNSHDKRFTEDNKYEECQQLLLVCHTFDHAEAFMYVTHYLAYNGHGHITEKRPDGFHYDHLRLPQRITRKFGSRIVSMAAMTDINACSEQINAAKGRLKTVLHTALYKPIEALVSLDDASPTAMQKLWRYEKSLHNTGAWPLEAKMPPNSIQELLDKLEKYKIGDALYDMESSLLRMSVKSAVASCENSFDGLCLSKFVPS